jgi:hypothetical protein
MNVPWRDWLTDPVGALARMGVEPGGGEGASPGGPELVGDGHAAVVPGGVVLHVAGVLISQSFTPYSNQLLGAQSFPGVRRHPHRRQHDLHPPLRGRPARHRTPGKQRRSPLHLDAHARAHHPGQVVLRRLHDPFVLQCLHAVHGFHQPAPRGRLPTVFFTLLVLFLVVVVAIQVAILLACLPISRPFKVLVALFGIGRLHAPQPEWSNSPVN